MEDLPVSPRVTALVVTRNCVSELRQMLTAIAEGPDPEALEVLVVDQQSTDGTAQLDEDFPKTTILRLPKFFGYTKALNIGIRTARCEFLLITPPTIPIRGDQVIAMCDVLSSNLDAAAVCPKTLDIPGNPLIKVHDLPDAAAFKAAWQQNGKLPTVPLPANPQVVPVPAVSDTAILIRRDFIKGMNYFDERYGEFGALWELFFQIRQANRKILIAQNVVVHATPAPGWPALPPDAEKAAFSSDFALGAAAYLSKHQGFGAGLGFRIGSTLSTLGSALGFSNASYNWKRFANLLLGQKIDGNQ